MRFGPWYPLADAGDHTPPGENVLQVRVETGLVEYPRGKSAMVHYVHATDALASAGELAQTYAGSTYLCRHLVELDDGVELVGFEAKLRSDFVTRFGIEPRPVLRQSRGER